MTDSTRQSLMNLSGICYPIIGIALFRYFILILNDTALGIFDDSAQRVNNLRVLYCVSPTRAIGEPGEVEMYVCFSGLNKIGLQLVESQRKMTMIGHTSVESRFFGIYSLHPTVVNPDRSTRRAAEIWEQGANAVYIHEYVRVVLGGIDID